MAARKTIGVLALQGAFERHAGMLEELGWKSVPVRSASELDLVEGLVLPGGESTAMLRLLDRHGFHEALAAFPSDGRPVLATCAGLILAAREVRNPTQPSFGWLDTTVERNGWGRQVESFEDRSDRHCLPVVCIRAPRIVRTGPGVEILDTLRGEPIFIRQGNVTGSIFHPELTADGSVHAMVFGGNGR